MIVYTDESFIFSNPNNSSVALSCVGALLVTEDALKSTIRDFKQLKDKWDSNGREKLVRKIEHLHPELQSPPQNRFISADSRQQSSK